MIQESDESIHLSVKSEADAINKFRSHMKKYFVNARIDGYDCWKEYEISKRSIAFRDCYVRNTNNKTSSNQKVSLRPDRINYSTAYLVVIGRPQFYGYGVLMKDGSILGFGTNTRAAVDALHLVQYIEKCSYLSPDVQC